MIKNSATSLIINQGITDTENVCSQWNITRANNNKYIIQPANRNDLYLCGDISTKTVSLRSSPTHYWEVEASLYIGGMRLVLNSGNTQYVIAESNNSLVLQTSSTQASTTELAKQAWKFLDVYTYTQLSSVTFSDLNIVHGQYAQAHISAKNSNNGSGNPTMATIADFTYEQLGSIVSVDLSGVFLGIKTGQRVIRATHKLTGVTTTFTVTVAPASSSYTTMSLDANYNDYISAGEHIWYKYIPDETCYYEIESFGSSDTYAILYYNTTIQEWNDDAGEGSNFKILTRLTEGNEYRLLVKGFSNSVTGSFQVKIKKAWPDAN